MIIQKYNTKETKDKKNEFEQIKSHESPGPCLRKHGKKLVGGLSALFLAVMVAQGCVDEGASRRSSQPQYTISKKEQDSSKYVTIMCNGNNSLPVFIEVPITKEMEQAFYSGNELYTARVFYTAADKIISRYGLKCDRVELVQKIVEALLQE